MSNNIPAKLKTADITRFATRAAQLEKAKPVVSYWCNYWVVNQILSKGLHNTDEECMKYTTDLMDQLEKFKSENADNDAVTDDLAGQAYVEEFGLETFQRGENAVRANKASLQTADTFQAAATFLELCQIWGQIDADVAAKVKFAKYHAVRIAKAVKAGEDPNLSNPATAESSREAEDGDIPTIETTSATAVEEELQNPSNMSETQKPRQASVEEVPDDFDRIQRGLAQQSVLDQSIHPSRSSSAAAALRRPADTGGVTSASSSAIPSPPVMEPGDMMDLEGSLRQRPSHLSQATIPDLPAAPSDFPSPASSVADFPSQFGAPPGNFTSLNTLQSFPPPVSGPQPPTSGAQSHRPPRPVSPGGFDDRTGRPPIPSIGPSITQPPKPVQPVSSYPRGPSGQVIDEDSISQAQKHARFAVSALNFDDINTAVKELRNAMGVLGAQ